MSCIKTARFILEISSPSRDAKMTTSAPLVVLYKMLVSQATAQSACQRLVFAQENLKNGSCGSGQ
jgi:hypothetical protein